MAKMTAEERQKKQEGAATQKMFSGYLNAVAYLTDLLKDPKTVKTKRGKVKVRSLNPVDKVRIKAAIFLVEQERGRAKQQMEISGNPDKPVPVTLIEVRHSDPDSA